MIGLKHQRHLVKQALLELNPKLAKKNPSLKAKDADLTKQALASWFKTRDEQRLKKENAKRLLENLEPLELKDLPEIVDEVKNKSQEKLDAELERLNKAIKKSELTITDRVN